MIKSTLKTKLLVYFDVLRGVSQKDVSGGVRSFQATDQQTRTNYILWMEL